MDGSNISLGERYGGLDKRERIAGAILVVAILAVYLLTLTRNFNGDPIYFAMVAEGLHKNTFFPPDHLLLPSIFWMWHSLWRFFGYTGRAIESAQWLNALAGATGVAALWATMQIAVRDLRITIPLAVLGGLGFGFWWVSVDAHGYSIPVLCLSVMLWLLVRDAKSDRPERPVSHGLAVAISYSAAAIVHKMAVLAGPGALLFLLLTRRAWRARVQASVTYVIACTILMGGIYIGIGAFAEGHLSPSPFLSWMTQGKGSGPFGTPFHPGYVVPKFARGFAQMFVWYEDESSVAGRQLLEGRIGLREGIERSKIAPLAIFWVPASALMIWLVVRLKKVLRETGNWPLALVVSGLTYFFFFSWWLFPDPWKWCYTLGPFLVLAALSFREFIQWASDHGARLGVVATVVLWVLAGWCAAHNWQARLRPDSIEANNQILAVAHRLAKFMRPADVLFTPYGRVASNLEYFGRRRTYSLYYVAFEKAEWARSRSFEENRTRYLAVVDEEIRHVQASGGRVFVEQLFDPSIDDWKAPWTDYRGVFGWKRARHDLEAHLLDYPWIRVFPDVGDLWLLSSSHTIN